MTYSRLNRHWSRGVRQDKEAGQSIVELALTLPILVLLLLGAVEFGRFAYFAIEISNAAKAAAQYGAQKSLTAADVSGMQAVAASDAPEVAKACTNFTTTIVQPPTCSCMVGGAGSSTACDGSVGCTGYIVQNLTISTSAQCKPVIYPARFGGTLTITGRAVQEVLQ